MDNLQNILKSAQFRKKNDSDCENGSCCSTCEYRTLANPDVEGSDDYCRRLNFTFQDDGYVCNHYEVNHNISELARLIISAEQSKSEKKAPAKEVEKPAHSWCWKICLIIIVVIVLIYLFFHK